MPQVTTPRNKAAMADSRTREPCISKSKFLWGLQCPKLLWHAYNRKDLIPQPDAQQQAVFDQGHEVGALAKQLYPDGIEVGAGVTDLDETLRLTRQALQARKPLFEAAFESNGGYCRVDILTPAPGDTWDVIEVKSTTGVKDVHLNDLAFQTWVLASAGLKLRRCSLMHIDPEYVRQGEVEPRQFFKQVDLTAQVSNASRTVQDELGDMATVIRRPVCPDAKIGPHCDDPYTCALHDQCWAFLPERNVTTLYRGGRKRWELLEDGITSHLPAKIWFGLRRPTVP